MSSPSAPICILDDDVSVLRSIERLLDSDGLTSQIFERPEEFLAHARSHDVKVAVLDVCLGDANGIEVQRQLREISPTTCVIIMTGRDRDGDQSMALRNGARAFLLKPFLDETLLAQVRKALTVAAS